MLKELTTAALLSAVIVSSPGYAKDGHQMLKGCNYFTQATDIANMASTDSVAFGACLGVITGVIESLVIMQQAAKNTFGICLPEKSISRDQLAKEVVAYLENNSDKLDRGAGGLTLIAIAEAFPCE